MLTPLVITTRQSDSVDLESASGHFEGRCTLDAPNRSLESTNIRTPVDPTVGFRVSTFVTFNVTPAPVSIAQP